MTDLPPTSEAAPWQMQPIALLRSPYREKFGIPRQPGLVDVTSHVDMVAGYDDPAMVEGLEGFSHLWLTFVFHACAEQGWRSRVRPPRLGGNTRVGVLASRAPFRPNHLGLSAVQLVDIDTRGGVRLTVLGADLLDGTPILDIKPYVPYADAIADAAGGFAPTPPTPLEVGFLPAAAAALQGRAELEMLIVQVLSQDPRPTYQAGEVGREYGMALADVDLRFRIHGGRVEVIGIAPRA